MKTVDEKVDPEKAIAEEVAKLQKDRGLTDEKAAEIRKMALEETSEYDRQRERCCSPPGHFPNLPPLLEQRRLHWKIPDGCFATAPGALYDRILLWQVPVLCDTLEDAKVLGGKRGFLAASHNQQDVATREAERGIIVGAGLHALDSLRSHGVDLGHIVYYAKNTVYAIRVDQIAGQEERLSLAREGDLVLSEDLANAITHGAARVEVVEAKDEQGTVHRTHYLIGKDGVRYNPMNPYPEDDL